MQQSFSDISTIQMGENILYEFDEYVDEYDSGVETEAETDSETGTVSEGDVIVSSKKTIDLRREIMSAFENMNQIIMDMKESLRR